MKKKQKLALVRTHYANALTTLDTVNKMFDLIEQHYDIDPFQIMAADSICSDDVNSIEYPARAHEMLGPFKMGGLDGFPFTGLTGMGAFAGHVPENGAVFIYYAPHIGVSKEGIPGEIYRVGQSKPSGCCGAARAALGKLIRNEITADNVTELDYQMNTIEQIFLKQKDRILHAANQLIEATEVMYEAIDDRIQLLVEKTKYPCKYVILMGAILINGDHDMGSFSSCRRFEIIDLETNERKDLHQLLYS
jgi:Limiting CO2-inducible proteins B/C beta carbonyic anhydrases